MPIHDLHCPGCGAEYFDVAVSYGEYGTCKLCNVDLTWTPRGFHTDVMGSEIVDNVLREAPGVPLTYRSTRDREAKMKRLGFDPAGDKVGGARNDDGYKRSLWSYGGQKSTKGTPKEVIRRAQ
jgi:hypothetical protein